MRFTTQVVALISALTTGALAADVYSAFEDSNGSQIGSTNFDIGNPGCFSVGGAAEVSFTQSGGTHTADGPYCLTAYPNGGCSGSVTRQSFANVELNDGHTYALNDGVANAGSYSWSASACPN